MTKIELAREIAKRTTPRFAEIPPKRGVRVGDAMRCARKTLDACLHMLKGVLWRPGGQYDPQLALINRCRPTSYHWSRFRKRELGVRDSDSCLSGAYQPLRFR